MSPLAPRRPFTQPTVSLTPDAAVSRRRFGGLVLGGATGLALMLTGCGSDQKASGTGGAGGAGRPVVVASTEVYGEVARKVAGDLAEVTVIIPAAQDPHSYESSAKDKLAVAKADIVLVNGGGYDAFLSDLAKGSGKEDAVLDAAALATLPDPHPGEPNEHIWYSPAAMATVAQAVEKALAKKDPGHAADYARGRQAFEASLAKLTQRVATLKKSASGKFALMTEPVPGHLFAALGLKDATDPRLLAAVEEDADIPPLVLSETRAQLQKKSVALLADNPQTASPQTKQLADAAKAAGVPVVSLSETMPAGQDYISWMSSNLDSVEKALSHAG